ncbi:MAG: helix-turn-helix transcriptional regulator [Oscillospiraceae bacterium]|nr:helix-turn-helix transcriptional regulator [Oscillospiraceae bacterium]
MNFSYEAMGRTVRTLRRQQKLTQEVLSGLAGIARTHLTMIENASIHANIETIWKLALALGMRPSDFFACVEREITSSEEQDV